MDGKCSMNGSIQKLNLARKLKERQGLVGDTLWTSIVTKCVEFLNKLNGNRLVFTDLGACLLSAEWLAIIWPTIERKIGKRK